MVNQSSRVLTLRGRLVILVVACVLPLSALGLCVQYINYRDSREATSQHTLDLARSLALALEREFQSRIAVLQVLALSRPLLVGDIAAFRIEAEKVVAQERVPGSVILLLRENGDVVLNTALPPGTSLPARRNLDTIRPVFANGRPLVSSVFSGSTDGRPVVAIEVPVFDPGGRIAYVLAINPPFASFADILHRQRPPEGWLAVLVDQAGTTIARIPNTNIGRPAAPSFIARLLTAPEGRFESTSVEGTPVLSAFSHAEGFGWSAGIAVPLAILNAQPQRTALTTLAAGLVLLVAGLFVAAVMARHITNPIGALRRLAAVTNGDPTVEALARALPETAEVADALSTAARERRVSEERRALLTREVDHRAKNVLAAVQSIVRMAPRTLSPAEFAGAIEGRVMAMARAHSLLADNQWGSADLRTIVEGELAVHAAGVRIDGSPVSLSPVATQPMGMLLHELATNAVKHGALSVPTGRVNVAWDFLAEGELRLDWIENGGPPIADTPSHRSFGCRLIVSTSERQLGGSLERQWLPSGLRLTLTLPSNLAQPASGGPTRNRAPQSSVAAP